MALQGGIGIIHTNLSIEDQALKQLAACNAHSWPPFASPSLAALVLEISAEVNSGGRKKVETEDVMTECPSLPLLKFF